MPETFQGFKQVYDFLVENKYAAPNRRQPIGRTKFYSDIRRGLFKVKDQNAITMDEVSSYILSAGLVPLRGNANETDRLASSEKQARIKLINLRREREEFALARDKDRYIEKSACLVELVSKLSASKAVALNTVKNKAPELIAAVGGDLSKQSMFIEMFTAYIEDAFNDLASVDELNFIVRSSYAQKL